MRRRSVGFFRASLAVTAVGGILALPPRGASAQAPSAACDSWEVEYDLSGNMQLSDTPMGQGDGVYLVGPGKMVLRFDDVAGRPYGRASLASYELRESFKVVSKTLFWKTSVASDVTTRMVGQACGTVSGALAGTTLTWNRPVTFRSEGTLNCDGSFCGKFGAPPPGLSDLHIPAHGVVLSPFKYSSDMKTFTMARTLVSKSESPAQTAHLALAAREIRRTCVTAPKCM
ncbi:MAG: hypothetical protein M3O50_15625 [Myxococcota bacterium]|nr:hypothetical protein [Myxococcota bacterium]